MNEKVPVKKGPAAWLVPATLGILLGILLCLFALGVGVLLVGGLGREISAAPALIFPEEVPVPLIGGAAPEVDACLQYTGFQRVPGWSLGVCGNVALVGAAEGCGLAGEICGGSEGVPAVAILIMAAHRDNHCYYQPDAAKPVAIFWPQVEGFSSIEVRDFDTAVTFDVPAMSKYGLGGANCQQ